MRLHVKRDFSITFFSTIWPPMVSERNGTVTAFMSSVQSTDAMSLVAYIIDIIIGWPHADVMKCIECKICNLQNHCWTEWCLLGRLIGFCRAHGVCSQVHILFILIEEMCKVELHLMMLHFTEAVMDSKVVYPINWSIISCRYVVRRKPSDFHLF